MEGDSEEMRVWGEAGGLGRECGGRLAWAKRALEGLGWLEVVWAVCSGFGVLEGEVWSLGRVWRELQLRGVEGRFRECWSGWKRFWSEFTGTGRLVIWGS